MNKTKINFGFAEFVGQMDWEFLEVTGLNRIAK